MIEIKKIFFLGLILTSMTSCNSIKIIEAIKRNVTLGRPNQLPKVSYSFNTKILQPLTIKKIIIDDFDATNQIAIYRIFDGEIISIDQQLQKGQYQLSLKLSRALAKEKKNEAWIYYKLKTKTDSLKVMINESDKIFSK